ncbi:alpha-galactosidase [Ruania zhangjianzhongii]|uniref:alpha-galactosidase n=1 Tax=Ruania zhangjianzhongii TaxID=2603206 RepID=UPI001F257941|nr:alpha-galactosidase [Ruania zhangjianzhongii]
MTLDQFATPDGGTRLHLRAGGVAVVLDVPAAGLPRIRHWGTDLGALGEAGLDALVATGHEQQLTDLPGDGVPLALLPSPADGWLWTPGLTGHRGGAHFSPAFTGTQAQVTDPDRPEIAHQLSVTATDAVAGLEVAIEITLAHSGLLGTRVRVTNTAESSYDLASLEVALPVPDEARELVDMTGRQLRERSLQRAALTIGTHLRESRRASAHEASLLTAVGTPGFSWRSGQVWAMHVAFSGNTRSYAERTNTGARLLGGGELLLPGEVRLAAGESYTSPWVYGSAGTGLDEVATRFHEFLRARPEHPRSPRPVTLNVWEAVYFDHRLDRLVQLADRAARVGVERYVLDDGWFRHRRDDTAGLGDWYVDEEVWPDGLGPLVTAVRERGMQFGLWFEPEMINEDSDLARAHPDWIMGPGERLPIRHRHQQVLNLTVPAAYVYLRERISALVSEYAIDYLKWDHNRSLVEAGTRSTARPAVHQQTLALYRLIDELKAAHPGLEIESCASGGGRIDLGILARTDRVWASDCNDPTERQLIESGTRLLLPPELIGSHVASPTSHTTGRTHTLAYRVGTAFFSHLGIEWDLTAASAEDLDQLANWIRVHKQHRHLLHTGTVVRADHAPEGGWCHGVVASDQREAIYAVVNLQSSATAPGGRIRLPGLDPEASYRLRPLAPGDGSELFNNHGTPSWWTEGLTVPGRVLTERGVQPPALNPERLALLHLERV